MRSAKRLGMRLEYRSGGSMLCESPELVQILSMGAPPRQFGVAEKPLFTAYARASGDATTAGTLAMPMHA